MTTSYIASIISALRTILSYMYRSLVLRIPVSYPGDPRWKKLDRRGKWHNKKSKLLKTWKFYYDALSHKISLASYPAGEISGESAGRQIWHCEGESNLNMPEFNPSENPNSGDKVLRKIMVDKWTGEKPSRTKCQSASEAVKKGISYYQMLQCDDGHWAGDYGGPMFLMPGLIVTLYLSKAPFPDWRKEAMRIYLHNHQQVDGGWGTHIECASTMFGTILSYVALRLLGEDPTSECMQQAHAFIMSHRGALYAPSWAKFWLAVLGVRLPAILLHIKSKVYMRLLGFRAVPYLQI